MDAKSLVTEPLLYFGAADLARVLSPRACREAIARAHAGLARDPDCAAKSLAFALADGSIHVKASLAPGERDCFVAKVNVNLPGNPARGLPTIRGLVVLMDARSGAPLALLDSAELTARRTAATAALAATFGARPGARRAALVGCGKQARYLVEAMADALPGLRDWRLFDVDTARAAAFAATLGTHPAASLEVAVRGADVVVTCTTAKVPYLLPAHLQPGCFVAAVGADNPDKSELSPACFAEARVLTDDFEQALAYGDLAHAVRAGVVARDVVHASLADLASGRRQGRGSEREVVIFDGTGTGLQDLAAARAVLTEATRFGAGVALPAG